LGHRWAAIIRFETEGSTKFTSGEGAHLPREQERHLKNGDIETPTASTVTRHLDIGILGTDAAPE